MPASIELTDSALKRLSHELLLLMDTLGLTDKNGIGCSREQLKRRALALGIDVDQSDPDLLTVEGCLAAAVQAGEPDPPCEPGALQNLAEAVVYRDMTRQGVWPRHVSGNAERTT